MYTGKKRVHGISPFHSQEGSVLATLVVFIFIILASAITLGVLYYLQQKSEWKSLSTLNKSFEDRLSNVERMTETLGEKHKEGLVNLSVPSVQKVDNVFLVAKLSATKYLTGVKVKGLMINATSLVQKNAKFRITIKDESREFTVRKISPGSSSKFAVDIPDVPMEEAVEAVIQNLSSSVSYYVD